MPKTLETVLRLITNRRTPRVILVGGSSEYLAEQAFTRIREAITASDPAVGVDSFEAGTELSAILDSYRTMSLFGGARLLVVPEVNAFVSQKELSSLFDKVVSDWRSAKTDRKRMSTAAKMLHLLGLVSADLEMSDRALSEALGVPLESTLTEVLAFARASGKKPTRGEGDAALLTEALTRGGATGTILLLRTGDIPAESATVDLIDREGAVIVCDLDRAGVTAALDHAIGEIAAEAGVTFDTRSLTRLRQRLGIERVLADKFAKDIPDIRPAIAEAERLVTLAGRGNSVTPAMIDREISAVEGGARYELGSLFSENKIIEAVVKLRELVAQSRREDPKAPVDIHYGKFLFPLADELRQMIGILSFARVQNINLKASMNYNRFKDTIADHLGDYLKSNGLVRQRPHPFPLHKKWDAVKSHTEEELFASLSALADIDIKRKSGGVGADLAIETFLLFRK